jgi:plasmid stability protein
LFDIIDIKQLGAAMTDLLIRDIDPELKRRLEESAQKHSQSLSEEAKTLIVKALATEAGGRKLGTLLSQLLAPEDRSDEYVFKIPGEAGPPPDFK